MITRALSVSEVNRFVKTLLDNNAVLKNMMIEGEISNFKVHSSGHLYFSLKDETATIACVMFSSDARQLKFRPENGMRVLIKGRIAVYERGGRYQVYVRAITPAGIGELYQAFEELKATYRRQGWFDEKIKKPIPQWIDSVGIVTSPTGAAIHDMVSVIRRRNPGIRITLYPALVQGEAAAATIAEGIQAFNRRDDIDVIIVGRGGGSMEDLWAFNEAPVAEAIHASTLPVIAAVGHETDFTIADFVADLRAPTPSVAAEAVSLDMAAVRDNVVGLQQRLTRAVEERLFHARNALEQGQRLLKAGRPEMLSRDCRLHLDALSDRMTGQMTLQIKKARNDTAVLTERLMLLNPENALARGFALAEDAKGRLIRSRSQAEEKETFTLRFYDGSITVCVVKE